jgi:glycosyltransferase involved in cell wall biosynthesis
LTKICHINTTYIFKAGSARRTFDIIRTTADYGYQITQIAGRDADFHPDWNLSGITFIHVPQLVKHLSPMHDVVALARIYRILKRGRYDLVHTHLAKAGVIGRLAAKLAGIPLIVHTVHGPSFPEGIHPFKRQLYLLLERLCARFTNSFVFVGEELREEYLRERICHRENTAVIRTGRPHSDFQRADCIAEEECRQVRSQWVEDGKGFLIGYVARLVPNKNQDVAIRVLKKVRDHGVDAHLVLIGEAHVKEEKKYQHYLQQLSRELQLDGYVHYTGYQINVFPYMKAMDALILPSKYEGLPNVAVEAALVGRPLVSFEVCGIHEVVRNGTSGFIVKQGDIDEMAERLIYLSQHADIAHELGEAAQQHIRGLFNSQRMVEEKLCFYRQLFSDNGHC